LMGNKKTLLARMSIERDKLLLAVAGLAPTDAARTAIGEWSVKDIVAHIAAWEDEAANRLDLISGGRGDEVKYIEENEADAWNAQAVADRKGQAWAETLEGLSAGRERLLEAVLRLSDEQYVTPIGPLSVSQWLPRWTAEHEAMHAPEILRWRDQQGV
jgi:uncharacterized protein (TIGR03083 family)